jgi:uncharacterized protein with HEPN domain
VGNREDLKNLCEVSKHISGVTMPQLYELITLNAADDKNLEDLKSTIEKVPFKHMEDTRHIIIKSPFRVNLRARCLHHERPLPGLPDESDDDDEVSGRSDWRLEFRRYS